MSVITLQCGDCEVGLVGGCFGLRKARAAFCHKCEKPLCLECAGDNTLIPFEKNKEPLPLNKSSIKSFCRSCLKQVSILDYSNSYDIVEPSEPSVDPENPNITLLWVHGSGGSRAMFRSHASVLAKKGYRSLLMDLPGHGTLVETTTLTLDACVETVKQIIDQECSSRTPIIYIGGSLGAYIGFYILEQLKTRFAGAILLDCGQNVGPDCSLKTRAGIWFLRKLLGSKNNKSMMGVMIGAIEKSNADYHIEECCYAGGMCFQQGPAQCDCMHAVAPADKIPTLDFPILFFNGSEDYRDSENRWLALCNDKERSSLKVYEGGDHFFFHDSRFVDDILLRMETFVQAAIDVE